MWRWDGTLDGRDPRSGELAWTQELIAAGGYGPSIATSDQILVMTPAGRATATQAIELGVGAVLWTTTPDGRTFSPPLLVDGAVYVGSSLDGSSAGLDSPSDGLLTAIDLADGAVLWTTEFRDGLTTSPVATAEGLVVATSDGWVFCD